MKYSKNQTFPVLRQNIESPQDIEKWIFKKHDYVSKRLNGHAEFTPDEKEEISVRTGVSISELFGGT